MLQVEGREFFINTPEENTLSLVTWINDYCIQNNVLDVDGEILQIEVNTANPFYLLLYGLGYRESIIQQLLYSLGCNSSIASSSENQLRQLMQLGRIYQRPATQATMLTLITAANTGTCVVDTNNTISTQFGGNSLTWTPCFHLEIPPGHTRTMIFTADKGGRVILPINAVELIFDTEPINFASIEQQADVSNGSEGETLAETRERFMLSTEHLSYIERCQQNMQNLPGLSFARVWFNYSNLAGAYYDDIFVEARHALLIIQGYNENIGQVYVTNIAWPTQTPDPSLGYATASQTYTQNNGQVFEITWIAPKQRHVYIRVRPAVDPSQQNINDIKNCLLRYSLQKGINATITEREIFAALEAAGLGTLVAGVAVSLDPILISDTATVADGTFSVQVGQAQVPVIDPEDVAVELLA